ncbi:hypothetical protein NJT12_10160 [Flavobacterium sp. AC]|uniref:DUF3828 domain-containing protein n=1 Tax=Flavobacterium azizsancarii TaxID=2961580 RepID=A0ABT4WBM1_9FLAO|nr:hypothetical protein [Flavobacterium azizsancarii]MDA6069979.1 hypothetical protein [Flavobacterium azizsancarii]
MKFSKLLFLSLFCISLVSFKPMDVKPLKKINASIYFLSDKQQLESLLRKTYEWIETKSSKMDFDVVENKKGDKYIGLNLKAHTKRLEELKKTNFFAQEFLDNYNKIGLKIGDNLKTNKMEYLVGDLPPYGNDANMWCDCQDSPDEYWKTMKISIVKIDNNKATLNWTWTEWKDKSKYNVKAIKENGIWKISYLEGFDYNSLTKI